MIEPLSEVPRPAVERYLRAQGVDDKTMRWKYFDDDFNQSRERGYVWIKDDQVRGFLGLIPFRIGLSDRNWPAAWTCDWSANGRAAGIGVKLLLHAAASNAHLVALGGNENTSRLLPRMAHHTVATAGILQHLILRAGAARRGAAKWLPRELVERTGFLDRVPLRLPPLRARSDRVCIEEGVAPAIEALLLAPGRGAYCALHDLRDLQWCLGRCPTLLSMSCYTKGAIHAATVFWRPRSSTNYWRIAVLADQHEMGAARDVLNAAIAWMYERGAMAVSAIASHLDGPLLRLLHGSGFWRTRSLQLFLFNSDTPPNVRDLKRLSYLDTDLAYRF